MSKYFKFLFDRSFRFSVLASRGFLNFLPDEKYVKWQYKAKFHRKLDLQNPKTFNEKLQWLKLYDRRPLYTTLVDKYAVRQYITDKIGEEYLIPLVGGPWKKFDEIDFDALEDQFVLKCTHDSGGLIICRDKSKLDIAAAKIKIEKCLKYNYYYGSREWPYKNVPPKIIAEKYMAGGSDFFSPVHKIFFFDGFARAMFIATDRAKAEETKFDFFDIHFKHLPFTNHPNAKVPPRSPESFAKMRELAAKLSENIPQVSVDFYEINDCVYFGELTLFHRSGMAPFEPKDWDKAFGEWFKLPEPIGGGYLIAGSGYILWVHQAVGIPASEIQKENGLLDYKFMCFDGQVKALFLDVGVVGSSDGHAEEYYRNVYDRDFNLKPVKETRENYPLPIERPPNYDEMVALAEKLSAGFPHIRVDLYNINGKIMMGEMTLYHGSGLTNLFNPPEWDYTFGSWINLPKEMEGQ